jgi:hypothetical protein
MEMIKKENFKKLKWVDSKISELQRNQLSKVNVSVWVEINGEQEEVIRLYDVYSNPFKVGDVLHIDVEELYPIDIKDYKPEHQANFQKENTRRRELFGRKKIRLVREGKYVHTKLLNKDRVEIEYFAKFHVDYTEVDTGPQ